MSDIGHYDHLVEQRDRLLTGSRVSQRARAAILGRTYVPPAAKEHRITVDLKAGTREVVSGEVIMLAPKIVRAPPIARPPADMPDLLPTLHRRIAQSKYSIRQILEAVAAEWQVSLFAVLSPFRDNKCARPRFAAAKLLRDKRLMSYSRIGFALGRRDHTTALHEVNRANALLESDPDWARRFHAAESAVTPL